MSTNRSMFEFEDNLDLLREENEIKPNLYAIKALRVGIAGLLISLILNEMEIFHIDTVTMRICSAIALFFACVPQFFSNKPNILGDARTKYVILVCCGFMTFLLETVLFIFVTPLCMLPMLLAMQYNTRRFAKLAIVVSGVIAAITPPLGLVLGLWDPDFFLLLLRGATKSYAYTATGKAISVPYWAAQITLYISFPWLMCVVMFGRLTLSVAKRNEENMKTQLHVRNLNRLDVLTGLYNQNTYKELLKKKFDSASGSVGVLFFDVDGLKRTNDTLGHEYGDLMLQRCAQSLQSIIDEDCRGFRIGGDEILLLAETENADVLDEKLAKWERSLGIINLELKSGGQKIFCHMSVGAAFGKKEQLDLLIAEADTKMYEAKRAYHIAQSAQCE